MNHVKRIFSVFIFFGILLFVPMLSAQTEGIMLGIDVLQSQDFEVLKGKRVGLLTHPAGVNRYGTPTIQVLLHAQNVNLRALYGPEHGIYGDEKANVPVEDKIDPRTKLPIYSLYGKYRKPTPKMLSGIDVLVIDLQDIGSRSYTYISCMRYAMEACFENNVEVVVLDRPNPLGGLKVDGPMLDKQWMSYVGAFEMPYVHGLTIGEIARISKNVPGWLNTEEKYRQKGKLTVIPMRGWQRNMLWPQTKLKWIATSPFVKTYGAALGYAMTGLGCQIGGFKHGLGDDYPFRAITYSGKSPEEVKAMLDSFQIPGVELRSISVMKNGKEQRALYVYITDWQKCRPTEISFYMMKVAAAWSKTNPFSKAKQNEKELFNKHTGSQTWFDTLCTKGGSVHIPSFIEKWDRDAKNFQKFTQAYWIYQK